MQQEAQMTLPIGMTIKDTAGNYYVVEDLLGRGGFGAVYLVRKKSEQAKLFALKEIVNPSRQEREQFLFEGDILKRLHHKALPRVYAVFEHEQLKRVYMLMDYINGRDLETLRSEQPEERFSYPLVVNIMQPIVEGIMYLHSQQPPIVHRDIKPANIIVPEKGGAAMLVDFGIAKEYVEDRTTSIIRHGSPGYAALEQYGSGTNPRTDIYALGSTFYTLLTGVIPVDAITRASNYKIGDPLEPARNIAPDIPIGAALALEKAMAITNDERFTSVEAFWQAFQDDTFSTSPKLLAGPSVDSVSRVTTTDSLKKPVVHVVPLDKNRSVARKRRRVMTTTLVAVVLLLLSTSGIFVYQTIKTRGVVGVQKVVTATPNLTIRGHETAGPANIPSSSLYPQLNQTYVGTIDDMQVSQSQTDMYLMNVRQDQKHIQGIFQGLGQTGMFTGTVTMDGSIEFTVPIYNGSSTMAFSGNIKIGGGMAGTYNVLNQNQQRTGQFGQWAVK